MPWRIPMNKITVDPALNVRAGGVNLALARQYKEHLEDFDPITVARIEGKVILVDGMHRLTAAQDRGWDEIDVIYLQGKTMEDAFNAAVSLNVKHGNALSRDERNAAAVKLLQTHPEYSNRRISRICGMSDKTIGCKRYDLEQTGQIKKTDEVMGVDGRHYQARIAEGKPGVGGRKHHFDCSFPNAEVRTQFIDCLDRCKAAVGTESNSHALIMAMVDFLSGVEEVEPVNVPEPATETEMMDESCLL